GPGALRRPRRLDLVGRRVRPLALRQAARAEPRPALRQRGVRGRAVLFGQHLQAAATLRAAVELSSHPRLRDPLDRGGDRRRLHRDGGAKRPDRRLCAPHRVARLGGDRRRGAAHLRPPGGRGLGMGRLFRRGAAHEGRAPQHGALAPPAPFHGAHGEQGDGPLHDRHHVEARGHGRGLRRRADAGLEGRRGGVHRRQHLLQHGRRAAHPDPGELPRRHHPPHGDGPRQAAPSQGGGADHRGIRDEGRERGVPGRHRGGGDAGARDRRPRLHPRPADRDPDARLRGSGASVPGRGGQAGRL
ncbi:MAG: Branched-chain amino acid aminotransferase, partial [uncultured Acetobacteraceae bacterium]